MNATETARLVQLLAAACPAQRFEPETPAVWAPLLADITLADATTALRGLIAVKPFVALCDIIFEVKRIRAARLSAPGVAEALSAIAAQLDGDLETYRRVQRAIGDGMPLEQACAALPAAPVTSRPLALTGLVRDVP